MLHQPLGQCSIGKRRMARQQEIERATQAVDVRPMVYLVALAILVRTYYWIKQRKKGFIYLAIRAVAGLAAMVFFFYWFWAFNYHQISLPDRLGFKMQSVDADDIQQEFERASASLIVAANALPNDLRDNYSIQKKPVMESELREDVEGALNVSACASGGDSSEGILLVGAQQASTFHGRGSH
jgi:hypothetical protein